jgi:uncharacterized protein YbjQ (UPF0145 family)
MGGAGLGGEGVRGGGAEVLPGLSRGLRISGLSGNEAYCLRSKGWYPGDLLVGNSVQSLGFAGGIGSAFQTMAGGEIENLTQLVSDGRHAALDRIEKEARERGAQGVTGVSLDVRPLGGLMEFLAIGSAIHGQHHQGEFFSTACSGQDLYCQLDAGYEPRHFVLGNVCYALGIGRGLTGLFRQFSTRGEVREFSDMYNHTRQLALGRLERDARERGCNAVVDISTRVVPLAGALEIVMVGTGSHHPALGVRQQPVTSELTGEELWNLTQLGYEPVRLVLGTSVYALGLAGGFAAMFKSLSRGEVPEITHLIHDARENCLAHIREDAKRHEADEVIGVKLFVAELGAGLIEVLAIGTAVKKSPGMKTQTPQLPPQAVIRDRDTFFDETLGNLSRDHSEKPKLGAPGAQANPAGCLVALIVVGMMFTIPCLIGLFALLFGK